MRGRQQLDPAVADSPLAERLPVLRRTLRGLPDDMLEALMEGLAKHGDELVAGRLFSSPSGGGCAVGVMLQELDPERFSGRPVRFWLRDRWRRGARSYHGPLSLNPRLKHLEWIFDDAAELIQAVKPGLSRRAAANAAGRWVWRAAEGELRWRQARDALAGDPRPQRAVSEVERQTVGAAER
jgi:hypothetical protein